MRFAALIAVIIQIIGFPLAASAAEVVVHDRFRTVGGNIVYDTETQLMWAAHDNGADIDWYGAENYCKEFAAGGFDDWRLPEISELATLYTERNKNPDGFFIADVITLTACCVWSADTNMGGAAIFSYKTGRKPAGFLNDSYKLRVLPVRSVQEGESGK